MSLLHHHKKHTDPQPDTTTTSPTSAMSDHPARQDTTASTASTAAVPDEKVELASVLEERLRAWKHVVSYLEAYVEGLAQVQKHIGSHYEKLAKLIADPLKEGQMFDSVSNHGIQGLFEHLRTATHGVSTNAYESDKDIKGHVLKELERLHKDIKHKDKELLDGALKATKALEKARGHTQKALEDLGKHTASYDAGQGQGSRIEPAHDPYVIKRAVLHKLNKQVGEENALKQDMVNIQENFRRYEEYIVQTIQQAIGSMNQHIGVHADKTKAAFGDVVGLASKITPDYEWAGFAQRYNHILADPSTPARSLSAIQFPNQQHAATTPLAAGTLQRKGKLFGKYSTHHYVITPARYLHEFSDNDDLVNDPEPQMSLYLPECVIGSLSPAPAAKFAILGKDSLKNQHLTGKHEFTFKAGSHEEARRFYEAISALVGTKQGGMTPPVVTPQQSQDDSQQYGVIAGHHHDEKQQLQQQQQQTSPPPTYEQSTPTHEKAPVVAGGYTQSPIAHEAPASFADKQAPVQQQQQQYQQPSELPPSSIPVATSSGAQQQPQYQQQPTELPPTQPQQQQYQQPQAAGTVSPVSPITTNAQEQAGGYIGNPSSTNNGSGVNNGASDGLLPGDKPIATAGNGGATNFAATDSAPTAATASAPEASTAGAGPPAPAAGEARDTVKDVKFASPEGGKPKKEGGMFGSLKRGLSRKNKE